MKMEPESEGGAQLAPSRSELKVGFSAPPIDNIGVGRRTRQNAQRAGQPSEPKAPARTALAGGHQPSAEAENPSRLRRNGLSRCRFELKVGLEPTTCGLRNRCSTTELLQHIFAGGIGTALPLSYFSKITNKYRKKGFVEQ